jgi:WD40 repeat protein
MIQHCSPISGVDSWADRYVATAGYDNQLILWDAATKTSLTRGYHDHLVNQCRFSRDGRLLVTASSDYTARIWHIPDLLLLAVLAGHDDDVEMAVPDPAGERVATASRDHRVRVFDTSGRLLCTMVGHAADVISVEWTPDGQELVSSSDDGTIRRWNVVTGELIETIALGGIETDTVVYDERGALYVGNDEGVIVIVRNGAQERVHAHQAGVKRLVLEPAQRRLLSASYDRTIKVWSIRANGDLMLAHVAEIPATIWLRSAAFLGVDRLVFGTFGSSYAVYDLTEQRWDLSRIEDTLGVNAVRIVDGATYTVGDAGIVFRDGQQQAALGSLCNFLGGFCGRVITGGQTGTLFDATTRAAIHQHWSPLNCCATFVRAGEQHLIVGAYTGEGLVFRMDTNRRIVHVATVKLHVSPQ